MYACRRYIHLYIPRTIIIARKRVSSERVRERKTRFKWFIEDNYVRKERKDLEREREETNEREKWQIGWKVLGAMNMYYYLVKRGWINISFNNTAKRTHGTFIVPVSEFTLLFHMVHSLVKPLKSFDPLPPPHVHLQNEITTLHRIIHGVLSLVRYYYVSLR